MLRSRLAPLIAMLAIAVPGGATPLPCGPEFLVNSDTIGSHGDASVARASDGGFLVTWAGSGGPGSDTDGLSIQARRYDAFGAPVGDQMQVNTHSTGNQLQPSVVPMPNGFVVVWQSDDGVGGDADHAIEAQRLDAAGVVLAGEFQVNAYTTGFQCCPEAAADPSGGFVVVWTSAGSVGDDDDVTSVQGQRFDATGMPIGTQFQVNTYTTGMQSESSVGRDAAGGFVVAWRRGEYETTIAGRRYDALGDAAGDEFQVSGTPTSSPYGPAVAVDPAGEFVVAWSEQSDIRAARFDASGQQVGGEFQVNSYTPSIQYGPALVHADDGSVTVAWSSWESPGTDQSFTNVQLRRLDVTGTPVGLDAQVNTTTKGRQEAPAIASLGGEDFVVAWSGYDNDEPTFRSRVWGQRFAATCITTTTTSTSTTTLPTSLLRGSTLRLSAGKGKRAGTLAVRVVSHDPGVSVGRGAGSPDDPTLHGGRVRIRSAAWGLDVSLDLSPADWRSIRRGWRSASDDGTVVVRGGKVLRLSLALPGAGVLATDPTPVDLLVQVGERRLCLAFEPGTAILKRHAVVAHDATAPSACLEP